MKRLLVLAALLTACGSTGPGPPLPTLLVVNSGAYPYQWWICQSSSAACPTVVARGTLNSGGHACARVPGRVPLVPHDATYGGGDYFAAPFTADWGTHWQWTIDSSTVVAGSSC